MKSVNEKLILWRRTINLTDNKIGIVAYRSADQDHMKVFTEIYVVRHVIMVKANYEVKTYHFS